MGGFFFAWAVGEGIVVWRWAKNGAPPTPGSLAVPSVLYIGLAALAEYEPARTAAILFAWAVDAAVLLQVLGKEPKQATGWPPNMINNPAVLLPGGAAGANGPTGAADQPATTNAATKAATKTAGSTITSTAASAGGIFPTPTGAAPAQYIPGL